MFASGQAFVVCTSVQWSPLFAFAALFPPALGIAAGVKPNLAFAMLACQSTRRAVLQAFLGGGTLLLISLAIQPSWPMDWLRTLHSSATASEYVIPITTVPGFPLALAVLRWRRPEARMLLCMAAIPQAGFFYDQFPLLLVPQSRRQMILAVGLSQLALLTPNVLPFDRRTPVTLSHALMPLIIVAAYLPALIMVLNRPNEGPIPAWIERVVSLRPSWLRGSSA
jgi:hypothetical protein